MNFNRPTCHLALTALLLGSTPALSAQSSSPPDISGSWTIEWVAANLARIPVFGDTMVRTRQRNLVSLAREGDGWVQHHIPCSLEAESSTALASTTFPPSFVDAIPEKTYPVRLRQTDEGWRYTADLGSLSIGFDRDAFPEGLPSEIDDPAIRDWDSDGSPGATVVVRAPIFGSVEIYVVQASHSMLDGLVEVDGLGRAVSVSGSFLLPEMAQRTIGASNRLFVNNPKITFQPDESLFRMIRTLGGDSCEKAAAEADASPSG